MNTTPVYLSAKGGGPLKSTKGLKEHMSSAHRSSCKKSQPPKVITPVVAVDPMRYDRSQITKAAQGAASRRNMHISKLTLVNYRNFKNTSLRFHKGVNTIIGENGSGKSNILRAIRLLLDDTMVRSAYRLEESDFSRSLGQWQGHWIIICVEFEEISTDESVQALFLHGAAVLDEPAVRKANYNLIFRPKKEIRSNIRHVVLHAKVIALMLPSAFSLEKTLARFGGTRPLGRKFQRGSLKASAQSMG
ncbi:DNA replication and repair protein RecF [compost metagenome]